MSSLGLHGSSNYGGGGGTITAEEASGLKDRVKMLLKSILCSSKDGLMERRLCGEYRSLTNESIPFERLGYKSVHDLVRELNIAHVSRLGTGQYVFFPIYDELTQELGALVQRQKNQPIVNKMSGTVNTNLALMRQLKSSGALGHVRCGPAPLVPSYIQKNIQTVLENLPDHKIDFLDFNFEYVQHFGTSLSHFEFGFKSLIELFTSIPHLVYLEADPKDERTVAKVGLKLVNGSSSEKTHTTKSPDVNNNSSSHISRSDSKPTPIKSSSPTPPTTRESSEMNLNSSYIQTPKPTSQYNNNKTNMVSSKSHMSMATSISTMSTATTESKTPLTYHDQVVANVRRLIDKTGEKGLRLYSIGQAYMADYGRPLEFEVFGYNNASSFILDNVSKYYRIATTDRFGDFIFYKRTPQEEQEYERKQQELKEQANEAHHVCAVDQEEMIERRKIEINTKLKEMKKHCANALKDNLDERFTMNGFWRLFEEKLGWRPIPQDFDCASYDALIGKLYEASAILIECDAKGRWRIFLPSRKPVLIETVTGGQKKTSLARLVANRDQTPEDKERRKELMKKYQEEFIENYVQYDKEISYDATLRTVAQKKRHAIIVANVKNPKEIQIQLAENEQALNMLMDDMEKLYCGFSNNSYTMPLEYIKFGRLCAALYPHDKNWHRCQIIGVNRDARWAKVTFLDYGGDSNVGLHEIKFLNNKFAELPVQAVQAHFFNVREPYKNRWPQNTINYILNLVMGKRLEAEVMGVNGGSLALVVYERVVKIDSAAASSNPDEANKPLKNTKRGDEDETKTKSTVEEWVSLNERIIKDAMGEWYDETRECTFKEFEIWSPRLLASEPPPPTISVRPSGGMPTMTINATQSSARSTSQSTKGPTVNRSSKPPHRGVSLSTEHHHHHNKSSSSLSPMRSGDSRSVSPAQFGERHKTGHTSRTSSPIGANINPQVLTPTTTPQVNNRCDEQDESLEEKVNSGDFDLKERKILVKIPRRRDKSLNILAINNRAFIHPSQLVALAGVAEKAVSHALDFLVASATTPAAARSYHVDIKASEATCDIFEWITSRLGIDTSELESVTMLRYDKMDLFLDNLLRADIAAKYKTFVAQAKNVPPYDVNQQQQ